MDSFKGRPALPVLDWIDSDSLHVGPSTVYKQSRDPDQFTSKTPLCDKLVARGILRNRNAEPEPIGTFEAARRVFNNRSEIGPITGIGAQPVLAATNAGPPASATTNGQQAGGGIATNTTTEATVLQNVLEPQLMDIRNSSAPTRAHPVRQSTKIRSRCNRLRRTQHLKSADVYQCLSFYNSFRDILLSCSATLAMYSSAITKQDQCGRELQQKEFIEYFDVV